MFKIGDEVVCIKADIMNKLIVGQSYLVSKVRDNRYYESVETDDVLVGHVYYGVDGSVLVYRDDKFEKKG